MKKYEGEIEHRGSGRGSVPFVLRLKAAKPDHCKWEAESAAKVTAEFSEDGTAKLTMFGQTLRGTYKFNIEDELEWTVNGTTKKMKVHVTPTELEVTDGSNQTIKYKRT